MVKPSQDDLNRARTHGFWIHKDHGEWFVGRDLTSDRGTYATARVAGPFNKRPDALCAMVVATNAYIEVTLPISKGF